MFRIPRLPAAIHVAGFLLLLAGLGWLVARGAASMPYAWQWQRVPPLLYKTFEGEVYPGVLLRGLGVTLVLSAWSFLAALSFGLGAALLGLSRSLVGSAVARAYVGLVRNTPLLVQLYLVYFVLAPILGLGRMPAAVLALGAFEGAFAAEIIRSGILAVPRGQWEAAATLGLAPWQMHARVVLPQALRIVLPPLTSLAISVVKHSAIVSAIAVFELTNEGRTVIADTFMTFEVWLTVAGIYLLVTTTMSVLARGLERRLNGPDAQRSSS